MTKIPFKTGKRIEIGNDKVLYITRSSGKYQAEVLDTKTTDMSYSKWYSDKKALNNFTKSYGVELIFERVIIEANPDIYQQQKKRLRDNKRRQIEAIDKQAQSSKERIRTQYKNRIELINRQQERRK